MGAAALGGGVDWSRAALRRWSGLPDLTRLIACLGLATVAYSALIARLASTDLVGDESGYLGFAANLLHGYYSPPGEIHLWWGPGYPAVLAAFLALDFPLLAARLMNGLFVVGALACIYATARRFVRGRIAVLLTVFLCVYLAVMQPLQLLLTEPLVVLLASLWMYFVCCQPARWGTVAAAVALACLALTKVLFGWVVLAALVLSSILWIGRRFPNGRRWVAMFGLALILCSPYLLYTYALTGRPLYWATSGGLSLYWMSSPYPEERGDWFPLTAMRDDPRLAPRHAQVFATLAALNESQQDAVLSALAVAQISASPLKYAQNWIANVGRLLVNYPYSFTPLRPGSIVVGAFNGVVVGLTAVAAGLLVTGRRRHLPPELVAVAALALVALAASTLVSAYPRQLVPLVPWLLVVASAVVWQPASSR